MPRDKTPNLPRDSARHSRGPSWEPWSTSSVCARIQTATGGSRLPERLASTSPRSRCGFRTGEPGTANVRSQWSLRSHQSDRFLRPPPPLSPLTRWCKPTSPLLLLWVGASYLVAQHRHLNSSTLLATVATISFQPVLAPCLPSHLSSLTQPHPWHQSLQHLLKWVSHQQLKKRLEPWNTQWHNKTTVLINFIIIIYLLSTGIVVQPF